MSCRLTMVAVEPKGGATVDKEPFPSAALPEGKGYELKSPDAEGRWEVSTYRWEPNQIIVNQGDEVTLEILGVNGAEHPTVIEGYDLSFTVKRGQLTTVTFTADKAGCSHSGAGSTSRRWWASYRAAGRLIGATPQGHVRWDLRFSQFGVGLGRRLSTVACGAALARVQTKGILCDEPRSVGHGSESRLTAIHGGLRSPRRPPERELRPLGTSARSCSGRLFPRPALSLARDVVLCRDANDSDVVRAPQGRGSVCLRASTSARKSA